MIRLCLRGILGCAIGVVCFGCVGQNIEGTWLGPLPLEETNACRIKIYSDHRFDVACGKMDWVGAGKYERDGNQITFDFTVWVRRGMPQKARPKLVFSFIGQGNRLTLTESPVKGKSILWERARL